MAKDGDPQAALGAIAAHFGNDDPARRALWAQRADADAAVRDALRAIPVRDDTAPFDPAALVRRKPRGEWEDRAFIGRLPDAMVPAGALARDRDAFAQRRESALEIVERRLAAIATHTGLNAFIDVFAETALDAARVLDLKVAEGDGTGALAGTTVAIKDIFDIEGRATRAGVDSLGREVAESSARAVSLLAEQDAIGIGLTNMHPLAFGTTSHNARFGRVLNPFVSAAAAGGSSGGSAVAVAMGMASMALGSDTGGSIRIPAAACGIVGLKPTFGRISTRGVYPLARTLDHVGPMTLTVADAAIAFEMLADEPCPASHSQWADLSRLRVAIIGTHFMEHLAPEVAGMMASARAALEACGAEVDEIEVPLLRSAGAAQWATIMAEALETNLRHLLERPTSIPEDVRVRLEMGMFVSAADYVRAQRVRTLLAAALDEVFEHADVVMVPTFSMPVPDADQPSVRIGEADVPLTSAMSRLTNPFNITGFPALAMPWGRDRRGIPLSIQFAAAPMDEVAILGTGRVLERYAVSAGAHSPA